MAGELAYFVLSVADPDRARAFYGHLLGWRFAPGNVPGGYQIEDVTPPGGLYGGGGDPPPPMYFRVDDVDAAVARVRQLGGQADEPQDIPSGRMANCRDDQGGRFGLWAPAAHERSAG